MLVRPLITLVLSGVTAVAFAGPRVLIEVADTSAYRISHEQLAELIPDLGEIDSAHLHLSLAGEARALHVDDGGDGRFGPGDHLSFFGERLQGQQGWYDTYAVHNVYTLSINDEGSSQAAAVASSAASPGSPAQLRRQLHLEEENLQIRLSNRWVEAGTEPDLWHWAKLTQVDPTPFQAPFALPALGQAGEVRLRLGFRGLSEIRMPFGRDDLVKPDDHVVEVRINGELVKTTAFESRHEHEIEFALPVAALQAQDNVLELRVPQRPMPEQDSTIVDVVMFNYVHLDYPITGSLDETPLPIQVERAGQARLQAQADRSLRLYGRNGTRVEGRAADDREWLFDALAIDEYQPVADDRYSVPAALRVAADNRWRDVEIGYDYLLISHPTLTEASQPLAEHHRRNGLRVAEINVLDLYDEFNHGVLHPRAIRDFIAHAYHEWPEPRPRFVLLVGDASFDIRSDRVDDTRYAKWVGRELTIPGQFGVIPGGEYEDGAKIGAARNLIPTWQYPSEEGHSASDNYFVAVDGDNWLPDLAIGRFPVVEPEEVRAIVDKTIRYATSTDFGEWRRRALFTSDTSQHLQNTSNQLADGLVQQGFLSSTVYPDSEASDNLPQINALNDALNEGQLLVHFIGHGGRYIWRTGPPDPERNHDLFTLDHVAGLTNADRLPMVLSMTCYSAPFDHPSADSIGERFLREPDRGAVAVFAASWRNSPLPAFSNAAVDELMTPGATIGEALMKAKHAVPAQHQRTLVETYNLLGDPAIVLQRPTLPFTAQARNGARAPTIELAIEADQAINGHAELEWLDDAGLVLATTRRELRGLRASIPVPNTARGAHDVRVHLVDRRSRSDGVALLNLPTPTVETESLNGDSAPIASQSIKPRVRLPVDDRIFTSGTVLGDSTDAAGHP